MINVKELIKLRKWPIIIFLIILIISILLLFSFNCNSKTYAERFLKKAKERFGESETKQMELGVHKSFLKGHVIVFYKKRDRNISYCDIEYPKSNRSEFIDIYVNGRHQIALRFKPVDVRYTFTLKEENKNELYLNIALNEEYTRSALKKAMPGVEPRHIFPGETSFFILNIFISLFNSILGSFIASRIEKRCHKLKGAKRAKKPGKKKTKKTKGG